MTSSDWLEYSITNHSTPALPLCIFVRPALVTLRHSHKAHGIPWIYVRQTGDEDKLHYVNLKTKQCTLIFPYTQSPRALAAARREKEGLARPHGFVGQRHGQIRVRKEEKTRPICTYHGPPLRYVLPPDALLGEAKPCAPSPVPSLPVIVPPSTASSCNNR